MIPRPGPGRSSSSRSRATSDLRWASSGGAACIGAHQTMRPPGDQGHRHERIGCITRGAAIDGTTWMRSGDVIAGRFEIDHASDSGGRGQVYRGRDIRSEEPVAIKVLHFMGAIELERFARETEVLSSL